jgi:hypothetical protein
MNPPGERVEAEHLVLHTLRDGWMAFRRAPFRLVGFALLVLALLALTLGARQWPPPADGALPLLGWRAIQLAARAVALLLMLWGSTGLLRGATAAVDGSCPGPGLLLRPDPAACWQLFLAALLVAGLLPLGLLPFYALIGLSGRFAPASDPLTTLLVALLPLVPALLLLLLLPLGPVLTRQRMPLMGAVLRSVRLGAGHRGATLVLAAVQLALLLVGSLHPVLLVGLALPLAICLGCAGERRLSRAQQRRINRTGAR